MMSRLWPLSAALFLSACGPAGAENQTAPQGAAIPPAAATRVEVATLRPGSATLEVSVPGEIEGGRDAVLASALGGLVERVAARDGQEVRRGQVLVQVDSEVYAAQVDQAAAQLALAESELERLTTLGDYATPQQRTQAETQVAVARAGLRGARAQLDRAVVRAPFDGVVTGLSVEAGEWASPGAPLVRVIQLDPVVVSLSVPDRDRVALHPGLAVSVTTDAASGIRAGTITHVGAAADLRTRAFEVEVEVPNPDRALLPGMIARVGASRSVGTDAVVIPQDWLVTRLDGQGVFVEVDGVARWRPVTLGAVVRDQVIVESGASVGDRVVITGHRELAEGDPLLVVREAVCCEAGRPVWGAEG